MKKGQNPCNVDSSLFSSSFELYAIDKTNFFNFDIYSFFCVSYYIFIAKTLITYLIKYVLNSFRYSVGVLCFHSLKFLFNTRAFENPLSNATNSIDLFVLSNNSLACIKRTNFKYLPILILLLCLSCRFRVTCEILNFFVISLTRISSWK